MADMPPRLAVTADHGIQAGYAPISWTAVASVGVAGFFVLLLVVMGLSAFNRGQPLIVPALLAFPFLAIVLAFVARRQIRASEGARTGEWLANLGWWLAVLAGLGYVAYLAAIEFAVRREANQAFERWSAHLTTLDPKNPKDPALYEAVYLTLKPGTRASAVRSPRDVSGMDRAFGAAVAGFRQVDLVRVCNRNPGAVTIRPHGLQSWEQKPGEITCTLTATAATPEGEFSLQVPMRAEIDEKRNRQWQFSIPPEGLVKSQTMTEYGREVAALEASAQRFVFDFMSLLGTEGQEPLAYLGFVHPGGSPERAADVASKVNAARVPQAAIAGGLALSGPFPRPEGWYEYLTGTVFAKPDGGPKTEYDLARFKLAWFSPGRLARAGSVLKSSVDINPVLMVTGDAVEVQFPVELMLGTSTATGPSAARARLVVRVTRDADPQVFADLEKARAAGTATVPGGNVKGRPSAWRVVRLESDLNVVTETPGPGGPGMPGMPGG